MQFGTQSGRCPSLAGALALLGQIACQRVNEVPTKHHYDDKEAALAHFEEPERDAWAQPGAVVDAIGIQPEWDVADIGAGSGYFTRRLATAASSGTTYAIDVDADFKGHIEEQLDTWATPNIVTRLAVYEHPLIPEKSVDLVFISNTYSFLDDRVDYFKAVHSALRPGGKLVVIDWRRDADCPRVTGCPRPRQRIPVATAKQELGQAGFSVAKSFDFLPYQYCLLLERRIDLEKPADPPPDPTPIRPPPPEDLDEAEPAPADMPEGE